MPYQKNFASLFIPLIVGVFALVFLGTIAFRAGFLGDDLRYLYEVETHPSPNERIEYIVKPLGTAFVWRPLANASWMGEYALFGRSPYGYHISNLLVVALTALLLFFIFSRLATPIIAAWAAALFLLFPNHYEVAVWLSGRTDGLAFFFSLAALALFILYREKRKGIFFALSLVFYFFALLTKESAAFAPLLMLFFDLAVTGAGVLSVVKVMGLYMGTAFVYLAIRFSVLGSLISTDPSLSANLLRVPSIGQFQTFLSRSLTFMNESVLKEFVPAIARLWSEWHVFVFILGGALLLLMNIKHIAKQSFFLPVAFGTLVFILFSLPVLSLAGDITPELKHSRFVYASSAGLVLLLALVLWTNTKGRLARSVQIAARVCVMALLCIGLVVNAVPWVRTGEVVARVTKELTPFQERLTSQSSSLILVHRIPGEVSGAYAFHDPLSFFQSARMRFPAMTSDIGSVGSARLSRSPFCEEERNTPAAILEWRRDHFVVREDDIKRWRGPIEQKAHRRFTTYQEFSESGWSLHDLKVENKNGKPFFIRTGKEPRLELAFPQSISSESLRNLRVVFSEEDAPQSIVFAWSISGANTTHPLNHIRSKQNTRHAIELCRYPNWAISDSVTRIQLRLPTSFQQGIISELSLES